MFFCYMSRPEQCFWTKTLNLWMPSFGYNLTSTQQNPNSTQPQLNSTPTQLNPNSTQLQLKPNSTQPQIKSTPTKFQLDLISTSISSSNSIQPYFNLKLNSALLQSQTQINLSFNLNSTWLWHKSNPILYHQSFIRTQCIVQ